MSLDEYLYHLSETVHSGMRRRSRLCLQLSLLQNCFLLFACVCVNLTVCMANYNSNV